jgi:hypothetical protein
VTGWSCNRKLDRRRGRSLTAEPGSYLARHAPNVGGNVYESIVTIDLGSVERP